jgi:hypothetical protein
MTTEIAVFNHHGANLLFDRETNTGDLTALWRAAGAPENKRPIDWTRGAQAQEILEALSQREKVEISHLLFVQPGRTGGTWAHWQIALIYAHYLSPELYLAWNEFARQCLDGSFATRLAALERKVAVMATIRPLATTQMLTAPTNRTQQVLEAISALGGRAAPRQLYDLIPNLSPVGVRVLCHRLVRRGQIRRVYLGCYELCTEMEAA